MALAPARGQSVRLDAPQKEFGYLAGDIVHTEAAITAPAGARLNALSLPAPGPISPSLELRDITATDTREGRVEHIKIVSDYQTFLATESVTVSEIPGFTIRLSTGEVHVPAWAFHVSPLRTVQGTSGKLPDLQPDHALALLPVGPVVTQAFTTLGIAAVAALGFAALRFRPAGFGRKSPPFAAACRDIVRLRRRRAPIEAGFKSLHHAYTLTAGQQLFAADLPAFTETHRNLAPLAPMTESFFAASRARFYARANTGAWTWEDLIALARRLRRAERNRA
jgi:hypothetical protein